MALEEEDGGGGIPEWVVTFGDMMSLLLTFFIMLVSLSEIKQEEKFQAMVESMRRQFGREMSTESQTPGVMKPRNSNLSKLATEGRAKRFNIMTGGAKVDAPVGDHPRVMVVRPGEPTPVGVAVLFDETAAELSDEARGQLRQYAADHLGGKPQKIEIRGHTSLRPIDPQAPYLDSYHLAYERARNVMKYLAQQQGIDVRRIRITVAGPNELAHIGVDPDKMKLNSRVEVTMLDELVNELWGAEEEQRGRFTPVSP